MIAQTGPTYRDGQCPRRLKLIPSHTTYAWSSSSSS
jgi:hypothetical protein